MERFNEYGSGNLEGYDAGADELAPHIQQEIFFHVGAGERNPERIAQEIGEGGVDAESVAEFLRRNGVEPEQAQGNGGHSQAAASGSSGGGEPLPGHVEAEIRRNVASGVRNPNDIARYIGQGVNPNHVAEFMRRNGVEPDYSQGSSSSGGGWAAAAGSSSGRETSGYASAPAHAESARLSEAARSYEDVGSPAQTHPPALPVAASEAEAQPAAGPQRGLSIEFVPFGEERDPREPVVREWRKPLAGWSSDGKHALKSPGGSVYPKALAPKNKRKSGDNIALSRFLRDTAAQGASQRDIANAINRKDRSTISSLMGSLPKELQSSKKTRQERGRIGRQVQMQQTGNWRVGGSSEQAAQPYQNVHLVPAHLLEHTQDIVAWSEGGSSDHEIAEHLNRHGIAATADNVRAIIQADAFRRAQNSRQG